MQFEHIFISGTARLGQRQKKSPSDELGPEFVRALRPF